MTDDNLIKALAETRAAFPAKYLREGHFLLEVHTAKTSRSREGRNLLILEFKVLDTNNELDHPIGSLATLLYFGDTPTGLKAFKTALCRVLCIDEVDLTGEMIRNCLCPNEGSRFSPLRGIKVEAKVEYISTRKGGRYTQTTLYSCEQSVKSLGDL